jgi:hypothetical protein
MASTTKPTRGVFPMKFDETVFFPSLQVSYKVNNVGGKYKYVKAAVCFTILRCHDNVVYSMGSLSLNYSSINQPRCLRN